MNTAPFQLLPKCCLGGQMMMHGAAVLSKAAWQCSQARPVTVEGSQANRTL